MKQRKFLLAFFLCSAIAAMTFAESSKGKNMQTLGTGEYTAKVKAVVCSGCGPIIEKTMKSFPGIESVKSNAAKSTVQFKVKPGATVKLADLQKNLRESSGEMGMGANYELSDIQLLKKKG